METETEKSTRRMKIVKTQKRQLINKLKRLKQIVKTQRNLINIREKVKTQVKISKSKKLKLITNKNLDSQNSRQIIKSFQKTRR